MMHPDITASLATQHRAELHRSAAQARIVKSVQTPRTRAPRPTPAAQRPPRTPSWILAVVRLSGMGPVVVS